MAPMAHRPQPSARAFLVGSLLAIALAFTVAGSVATAGRVARPSDSTASASGYSLVDTWRDVPDVTRVVAGLDGQMHLLATGGSSVWHTASDGTLLSQTPTYGLSDIAVEKGYARKNAIVLYLSVWAALMLAMGYAVQIEASSVLITVLFLGSGLVVFGTWSPYYALLGELAPPQIVGTVFGLANFIGFLSAWVAPHFTGFIKDTTGSFAGGLYVAGAVLAVGTVLIFLVGRFERPKPQRP